MAEAQTVLSSSTPVRKRKRKSYTREEKIKVVNSYYSCGQNLYQTCKTFSMNSKTIIRWIKDEEKIRDSKKGSKRAKFICSAENPGVEDKFYEEYKGTEEEGSEGRLSS